jgi:hypothetical protein
MAGRSWGTLLLLSLLQCLALVGVWYYTNWTDHDWLILDAPRLNISFRWSGLCFDTFAVGHGLTAELLLPYPLLLGVTLIVPAARLWAWVRQRDRGWRLLTITAAMSLLLGVGLAADWYHTTHPLPWALPVLGSPVHEVLPDEHSYATLHVDGWHPNLPAADRPAQIPYRLLLIATLILPALWLGAWRRQQWIRRQRSSLCPNCGYDLRATPDRCPECGTTCDAASSG